MWSYVSGLFHPAEVVLRTALFDFLPTINSREANLLRLTRGVLDLQAVTQQLPYPYICG